MGDRLMQSFANLLREPVRKNPEEIEIPPDGISLDLLRAIYRNSAISLSVRIRCAMACLPFETPKLAVSYQASESDFAELLDRRIKHMEEMKMITHQPQTAEIKPPMSTAERRLRRI
jgi:hypothetical protein